MVEDTDFLGSHVKSQQIGGQHHFSLEVGDGLVQPLLLSAGCGCGYQMRQYERADAISFRSLSCLGY